MQLCILEALMKCAYNVWTSTRLLTFIQWWSIHFLPMISILRIHCRSTIRRNRVEAETTHSRMHPLATENKAVCGGSKCDHWYLHFVWFRLVFCCCKIFRMFPMKGLRCLSENRNFNPMDRFKFPAQRKGNIRCEGESVSLAPTWRLPLHGTSCQCDED